MPHIEYYAFWQGFYNSGAKSLKAFFEAILSGDRKYELHSVFPLCNRKLTPPNEGVIKAHFSGEPFSDPPDGFDLNLVMEEDSREKKIVFCPLFAIGSYEHNYWPLYWTPRVYEPKKKTRFCAFVVSNRDAKIRNRFFEKLSAYKRVDSCGLAMNNCGGFCAPREGYLEFLSQYKFMICFENTSKPYYITEKLHNAYLGGTIPIYWGCTNAKTWFNQNAFLQLEDTSEEAMDALIAKIIELDNDEEKYRNVFEELLLPSQEIPHDFRIETMRSKVDRLLAK